MIPQFDPKQELSYPSRSLDTLLGIVVCVGGSVWGYGYGVDSVHGVLASVGMKLALYGPLNWSIVLSVK